MSVLMEILVGVAILIGLVGIVVPFLPGAMLIFAAILTWSLLTGTTTAWIAFAVAASLLLISGIVKFTWPGRKLRDAGIPARSLMIGGLLGIVGFFVIPVLGLPLGFIAGTYLCEAQRLGTADQAWQSTMHATKAVGLSILIELLGALLAAGVWLGAAVLG